MTDLHDITLIFGQAYDDAKASSADVKRKQEEFFAAIDNTLSNGPLPQQVIDSPDVDDPQAYITTYYPGWRLVHTRIDGRAVIEEDPKLMKFSWINPTDKRVYGRTTAQGGPSLDDERLRDENPELWNRITTWPEPWYSLVADAFAECFALPWSPEALAGKVDAFMRRRGVLRVLRNISTLGEEDESAIQEYLVPGALTTRLVPPRAAKPEELEANE